MPYSGASVQGVAVDTSGAEDTFWVATAGDRKLRHFHLYGGTPGQEITGDVFDWAAAGFASNPNGLAYDPVNDALLVAPLSGTTVRRIAANPAASPRVSATTWTLATSTPDQLHYNASAGRLYYTTGANGADGLVRVLNMATGVDAEAFGPLQYAQAIEGLYIDQGSEIMTVLSDGGYHTAASPALNIAIKYQVAL
jgi:hypothetical protein